MPLKVVGMKEIEQIFTVIDRIGVHREAVVIPLKPASPGSVKRLANGKFEIVVDADVPLDEWLPELERRLLELGGGTPA
ncbi:hypothetical protein K2Z84_00240 [Candidatus Binatia bacterium]|jgi:hypothetical protein|nr:hypothetical protein [Candidatus Binatia bacterium]